jgi:acetyl esterase/lipase
MSKIAQQTVVYKRIGALEIEVNVYWPEHEKCLAILLYFHGKGSPVQGSRWDIPPHMYNATRSWSFALVSADYRLAPQAGIEEMLDDVQDCIGFVRDPAGLAATLPKGTVDINRLAVSGTGGGGYLALIAGIYVYPKPQAVLAISPITDPLGSSFRISGTWNKSERKGLSTTDAQAALKSLLDRNGQVVSNSEDMPDRK